MIVRVLGFCRSSIANANCLWSCSRSFCYSMNRTVMRQAVIDIFSPSSSQVYVDLTFGAGGHTCSLLDSAEDIKVYALDRDPGAHHHACKMSDKYSDGQVVPMLGLFSDLPAYMRQHGVKTGSLDGIIIETGPSWMQLEDPQRGFNWDKEGILDMRMDADRKPDLPTAADVINSLDSVPLSHIFKKYGDEKHAKKVAKTLVDSRYMGRPVETTTQLSELVTKAIGTEYRMDVENREMPSCCNVFSSLRMFINNELNELDYALHVAFRYLKFGGKLVCITYGSTEDKIVKNHLMGSNIADPRTGEISHSFVNSAKWYTEEELARLMPKKWTVLHRKVKAKVEEISINPRSSFAVLRAACKADPKVEKQEIITGALQL